MRVCTRYGDVIDIRQTAAARGLQPNPVYTRIQVRHNRIRSGPCSPRSCTGETDIRKPGRTVNHKLRRTIARTVCILPTYRITPAGCINRPFDTVTVCINCVRKTKPGKSGMIVIYRTVYAAKPAGIFLNSYRCGRRSRRNKTFFRSSGNRIAERCIVTHDAIGCSLVIKLTVRAIRDLARAGEGTGLTFTRAKCVTVRTTALFNRSTDINPID